MSPDKQVLSRLAVDRRLIVEPRTRWVVFGCRPSCSGPGAGRTPR